jgi:hypothetical protein
MEVLSGKTDIEMVKQDHDTFYLPALHRISSKVTGAADESTVSIPTEGKDDAEIEQIHPLMMLVKYQ